MQRKRQERAEAHTRELEQFSLTLRAGSSKISIETDISSTINIVAQRNAPPLESGWINLHLLLWKHLVHLLTKVETEDAKLSEHEVWQAAWHRLERKAMAKQESTNP